VTRPILVGCAALFLVAAVLGLGTAVLDGAYLANISAASKPDIVSCTGPVPHVEAGP
jgi:hypothetical protein